MKLIDIKANKSRLMNIFAEVLPGEMNLKLQTQLNNSDFFTAPASVKFHLAEEGGLCQHSLNVYDLLKEKNGKFKAGLSERSVAVCGLLHDVCKINFYKQIISEDYKTSWYEVDDRLPLGHGEKSIILLQRFGLVLNDAETFMIRWHMAGYDPSIHFDYPNGYAYRNAVKMFPEIYLMVTADLEATFMESANKK